LNLPEYDFKIRVRESVEQIFDPFRKKFVRLTPEEWVRMNFAMFLSRERGFPAGRLAIERSLRYNRLSKRCDILAHDDFGNPLLLVECKAPGVTINQKTFDQIMVYNLTFRVNFLLITNGLKHYACKVDFLERKVNYLNDIPHYSELIS